MELTKETIEQMIKDEKIEFKNAAAKAKYAKLTLTNSLNSYGRGILDYMNRWAKAMQYLIKNEGYSVAKAARETEFTCDYDGITGFMYSCAFSTLCDLWKYGDELRNKDKAEEETTSAKEEQTQNDGSNSQEVIDKEHHDVFGD